MTMPASTAKAALTTTFSWNGATVADLKTIGDVEVTADALDKTHLNSPGGFKEKIPGLFEVGPIPIAGSFISDDAAQAAMWADMRARTERTVILTGPSSVLFTWTATAFISGVKFGGFALDGILSFEATITVTGEPVLAITASNNLSALVVTTGTLVPVFAAGTYAYVAHVATGVASVTMTATFAAGVATLTHGTSSQTLTTTVPSSAIALGAAGSLTPVTIVVQETAKTAKTYTITVERAAA